MTAQDFKLQVLQLFFRDMHRIEQDNYPRERPNPDGIDRSQTFDLPKHVQYLDWFYANYAQLFDAYAGFANAESRQVFMDLIRYRLSGHLHARIDGKWKSLAQEAKRYHEVFVPQASAFGGTGMLGALVHYDAEWNGERYEVDTVRDSLIYSLVYRQYFYEAAGIQVHAGPGDYVIDGGAFTGDSACVFSRAVGLSGRVYTFDPVQNHLDLINANVSRGYGNIEVFPYGLSDRTVDAPPIRLEGYHPGWRVEGGRVPLVRIDDLVIDGRISRVDFIKMDIEGSEMAALHGALATIHKYRPKLAISVYHKPNDLFEIQHFINSQGLGYRFYFDHYTYWDAESVLYGVCENR